MASKGASPEVVSVEVPASVSKSSRSPRLKPTPAREASNKKKDKQKATQPVHEFSRKNQKKEKPTI